MPGGALEHLRPWTVVGAAFELIVTAGIDNIEHLAHTVFVGVIAQHSFTTALSDCTPLFGMGEVVIYLFLEIGEIVERHELLAGLETLAQQGAFVDQLKRSA